MIIMIMIMMIMIMIMIMIIIIIIIVVVVVVVVVKYVGDLVSPLCSWPGKLKHWSPRWMKSHLGIEMQSLHIITAINNMPAKLQHLSYVAKLLIWIFTMAKLEIDHGKNHFRFQNDK